MMDFYGFYTGKVFDAYRYLGAHVTEEGVVFRTFAPNAVNITLMGDFNDWKETNMKRIHDGNFWEVTVENAKPGMMYKYCIYQKDGKSMEHCDPYGFGMELRPKHASIIRDMDAYKFKDEAWLKKRTDCKDKPLNIYEVHFGSFKKPGEEEDDWYTYTEMINVLIPHLKKCGYNYLEIMPLSEHPSDQSWGYQNTGFFSPTSRYGTLDQLKEFVDACHANDIGIIMDFVPVHFAVDGYGLAKYDGTPVFEYPYIDIAYSEWGSCNFMHSRGEVRSFLQSAANYWLEEFHIDGLRMDAISRIIYWMGNEERGVNVTAVDFLQYMNKGLKKMHPTAILAAEDSTSYPKVTKPVKEGGLGFDYKWDMGWMNDTLKFFQTDPQYRVDAYHKLTFSMMYYYNDNFMLPFSHDEVVHGKATILQKMAGDYEDKFPQGKTMYMYMFAHPGKKLNFMGNEIGQLREWDEKREQDWFILKYPKHDSYFRFMRDLNKFYLEHPAFSALDFDTKGFEWRECNAVDTGIMAFERTDGKERILALFNLSNKAHKDYELTVPWCGELEELMSSETDIYGGEQTKPEDIKLKEWKAKIDLKPYSAAYYLIK